MKAIFATAALLATTAVAFASPVAMDRPLTMGSLETVCTGIGEAKDDPRWTSYPIRIEFSNGGAQYLSGAHVMVSHGGTEAADVDCPGAWLLLKGPAGSYKVTATIDGSNTKPVTAAFEMGHGAQKRIVLRFPDFQPNE
jgi:hypothetical protein